MEPRTVYLKDRRVKLAGALEIVTLAIPALALISTGSAALPGTSPGATALAWAEIVTGALLVGAAARELRELRSGRHREAPTVSWLHLLAAAVLFLECYQRAQEVGKFSRPALVTALLMLPLAFLQPLFQRRQAERRFVRVDDEALSVQLGKFRKRTVPWARVRSVDLTDPGAVRIALADGGERRIGLRMIENRDEVTAAVAEAAALLGLPVRGGPLPSGATSSCPPST